MASSDDYVFVELSTLIRMARVMGQDSACDGALVEWCTRSRAGEMPTCIQSAHPSSPDEGLLVFDLRDPPEFLPLRMKMECAMAVTLINQRRQAAASATPHGNTPHGNTPHDRAPGDRPFVRAAMVPVQPDVPAAPMIGR